MIDTLPVLRFFAGVWLGILSLPFLAMLWRKYSFWFEKNFKKEGK